MEERRRHTHTALKNMKMSNYFMSFVQINLQASLHKQFAIHIQGIFHFRCSSESTPAHNAHFKWKILWNYLSRRTSFTLFMYCVFHAMFSVLFSTYSNTFQFAQKHRYLYM